MSWYWITVLFCNSQEGVQSFMQGMEDIRYRIFRNWIRRSGFSNIFYAHQNCPKAALWFSEFKSYNQYIRNSDFVLCAPGGIDIGGYQNWKMPLAVNQCSRTEKKDRNIWPIHRTFQPLLLIRKNLCTSSCRDFKKNKLLSLRDKQSQKIAEETGILYVPAIETAFACQPDCRIPVELSYLASHKYAVFVPNQLFAWHKNFKQFGSEPFERLYKLIIQKILSYGYRVVMLPQLFGRTKVDRPYFESLAGVYDRNRVIVIPDTYDSDIQQRLISEASFVVGARCHSIIFAITSCAFLCLSYEHKMDGCWNFLTC